MTPQEAIKILKPLFEHCKGKNECLGYIEHFFTKDEEEALDMAIKALEQQPCEDCISRAEAIEWMENIRSLNRYYHPKENDDETLVSEVISRLKQVPSVTPKTENEAYNKGYTDAMRDIGDTQ